ncbi:MAG: FAD-binding oxidoreductase [Pseudomonadota bacterium]
MPLRHDLLAWGRAHRYPHTLITPAFRDEALRALPQLPTETRWLPRGLGRSYGDSGLNADQLLVDATGLDRFIALDVASGVLECEAGMTLADILQLLETRAAQAGGSPVWFLPVSPGTKFVTVGGAIANDVHGKNHHRAGCFGSHVRSLKLLRSSGEVLDCSTTENAELFAATIAGLGLTGLILSAVIQLKAVPGLWLETEDVRYGHLDEFFSLSETSRADWEYDVAWLDCLASGAALGRGVFSRARHVAWPAGSTPPSVRPAWQPRFALPVDLPSLALSRLTVGSFNALLWHRAPATPKRRTVHYDGVFYPLDAIGQWNRLYGKRGFYQYQCVLPQSNAPAAVRALLQAIAASGEGSFLAVLKTFGARSSPGLLSFPMPGTTLALDFANRGPRTLALLTRLDSITHEAGGRIYPAKDGRVSAADFQQGYPQWQAFARHIDPRCSSSFWRRVSAPASS